MRKIYFLFFLIILFVFNCAVFQSTKEKEERNSSEKETKEIVQLTGIINVTDEDYIYLVVNWKSRSKKTYEIIGDNRDEFRKLNNKIIIADCIMVEEKYWSGKIKIIKYRIQ
ncbi:MAG TPA: hypothetical protein PLD27_01065 [bacterium]|nr:hypothetical protein [bacterium]HOL46772.1 hypothetical protein [bacterium]HPQ17727.1 hypothetical protein [bacterium]